MCVVGEMENWGRLSHLFVTVFLSKFSMLMVNPAIPDVTLAAVCPGKDECSAAIYITGFQQAVYNTPFVSLVLHLAICYFTSFITCLWNSIIHVNVCSISFTYALIFI